MAVSNKKFLDIDGLTYFGELLKSKIDAKASKNGNISERFAASQLEVGSSSDTFSIYGDNSVHGIALKKVANGVESVITIPFPWSSGSYTGGNDTVVMLSTMQSAIANESSRLKAEIDGTIDAAGGSATTLSELAEHVAILEDSPVFTGTPGVSVVQTGGEGAVTIGETIRVAGGQTTTVTMSDEIKKALAAKGYVADAVCALRDRLEATTGAGKVGYNATVQGATATTVQAAIAALDSALTSLSGTVGNLTGIQFEIVSALPQSGNLGTIYLMLQTPSSANNNNIYDEWVWLSTVSKWEKIGSTDVDLSNYWSGDSLVAMSNAEIASVVNTVFA